MNEVIIAFGKGALVVACVAALVFAVMWLDELRDNFGVWLRSRRNKDRSNFFMRLRKRRVNDNNDYF